MPFLPPNRSAVVRSDSVVPAACCPVDTEFPSRRSTEKSGVLAVTACTHRGHLSQFAPVSGIEPHPSPAPASQPDGSRSRTSQFSADSRGCIQRVPDRTALAYPPRFVRTPRILSAQVSDRLPLHSPVRFRVVPASFRDPPETRLSGTRNLARGISGRWSLAVRLALGWTVPRRGTRSIQPLSESSARPQPSLAVGATRGGIESQEVPPDRASSPYLVAYV